MSGGFWPIFYAGTGPAPVQDWSMLVEPGDIVRLEWFKPELSIEHISGHSTTVLAAVNAEGMIEVYDNIDYVDHVSTIGVHTTSYWQETNPSGIKIYRASIRISSTRSRAPASAKSSRAAFSTT